MTVVRVNPESMRQYAANASEGFARARTELEALVRDAVGVRYHGVNAAQFKQQSGQLAKQCSEQLLNDFRQIAGAVQASTSNIAASLGGRPVEIAINGTPIPDPVAPPAEDFVDADLSALEALVTTVDGHLNVVKEVLTTHLTNLQATDWQGQAKQSAESSVTTFTNAAVENVEAARQSIATFIRSQIDATRTADV